MQVLLLAAALVAFPDCNRHDDSIIIHSREIENEDDIGHIHESDRVYPDTHSITDEGCSTKKLEPAMASRSLLLDLLWKTKVNIHL